MTDHQDPNETEQSIIENLDQIWKEGYLQGTKDTVDGIFDTFNAMAEEIDSEKFPEEDKKKFRDGIAQALKESGKFEESRVDRYLSSNQSGEEN